MKTDSQLQRDVLDELRWDPIVDHADIGVSAHDGVITLSGIVHSFAEKEAAESAARRTKGVKAIAEDLVVRLPSDVKNTDAEIAERIVHVFAWNSLIPKESVQVKVERGYVTLTGKVDWHYQSQAARDSVAKISGVVGICNNITIQNAVSHSDVRQRIEDAIKRQAAIDAQSISVAIEGHKVKLSGNVHSWSERRSAEKAAWSAPGVNEVVDNISITI